MPIPQSYRIKARARKGMSLPERLAQKSRPDQSGCIIWRAARTGRGYPALWWEGHSQPAHRLMCFLAHGPAPEGRNLVLHSCGNPPCINPLHLRWGSPRDNWEDYIRHREMRELMAA